MISDMSSSPSASQKWCCKTASAVKLFEKSSPAVWKVSFLLRNLNYNGSKQAARDFLRYFQIPFSATTFYVRWDSGERCGLKQLQCLVSCSEEDFLEPKMTTKAEKALSPTLKWNENATRRNFSKLKKLEAERRWWKRNRFCNHAKKENKVLIKS